MKKTISALALAAAAALFVSGCKVKDFYTFVDDTTCQQGRGGRAEASFKEGFCPETNAAGKPKVAGFCVDGKDADSKIFAYEPLTAAQLKDACDKVLPGSSYKEK